jgi:hypothetical protein
MRPAAVKTCEVVLKSAMRNPKFQAFITQNELIMSLTTGTEKLYEMMKEEMARYSRFTPGALGWEKKYESCKMRRREPEKILGGNARKLLRIG